MARPDGFISRFKYRVSVTVVGQDQRKIEIEAGGEHTVDCPYDFRKSEFQHIQNFYHARVCEGLALELNRQYNHSTREISLEQIMIEKSFKNSKQRTPAADPQFVSSPETVSQAVDPLTNVGQPSDPKGVEGLTQLLAKLQKRKDEEHQRQRNTGGNTNNGEAIPLTVESENEK